MTPVEIQTAMVSATELERSVCIDSFHCFVQRFWHEIIPEEPVWNWHIEVICQEMQEVAERVFRGEPKEYDLLINVPPGSTKSTICSVMFPAWVWTRMPTAWTICGSYSYTLSMELSRKSRDVIQSDRYARLFGEVKLRADQNTKGYFVNEDNGGRFSTSIGGTVTGYHGHFLIIDDPLNPTEAVSEVELKRANDWIASTLSTRKKNKTNTPTVLIMQRLHEDDPSGKMLESRNKPGMAIRHICLPAEIDDKNARDVKPRRLRKRYIDGLLDPVRMNREVLAEMLGKLLEYGYAGQFQQNPVPRSGGMFKVMKIIIGGAPPFSWRQKVRFWDKAGTEGGGAYTVGVLMAEDMNGRTWILDVIRVQLDTFEREVEVKRTAILDGHDVVVGVEQEPGSGGKESAQRTVANLKGYVVEVVLPKGDKVIRAMPFSSQVNASMVHMIKAPWNDDFLHELALFPLGKYKDQVDASSGAFTVMSFPGGRIGVIK